MYVKYSSIPLKSSTSIVTNNLSILYLPKEKLLSYAVIGKNCVNLVRKIFILFLTIEKKKQIKMYFS
jgi:hypothetical protein